MKLSKIYPHKIPKSHYLLRMQKDVSFLNKAPLRGHLERIKEGAHLMIDGTRATFIDQDILETLSDYILAAKEKNIHIELKNLRGIEANFSSKERE